MIHGVNVKKLKVIPDERGFLMEMLRSDDAFYQKFGQAYLTTAYPGVVKAWHYHKTQTDNFVVVKGMMKVVLYDGREDSPTKGEVNEFFMGEQNQILITIPPRVMPTRRSPMRRVPTSTRCRNQPRLQTSQQLLVPTPG